jgi:hypothetical protein
MKLGLVFRPITKRPPKILNIKKKIHEISESSIFLLLSEKHIHHLQNKPTIITLHKFL